MGQWGENSIKGGGFLYSSKDYLVFAMPHRGICGKGGWAGTNLPTAQGRQCLF